MNPSRPGCSGPHPLWPWTLQWRKQLQLLFFLSSVSSRKTPKSFSAGLVSMSSFPILYSCLGLTWVHHLPSGSCRPTSQVCPCSSGWHLILLFCQLHCSASCHLHVYVIDKDVKEHNSQERPRGTPLMNGLHLDIEPLTTNLWLYPSSTFLIHWGVHPSNPCLSSLEMSCGTMLKAELQVDDISQSYFVSWLLTTSL